MGDELTERIIGAAIEVHRHLGPGLLEAIYEGALCHEFSLRSMDYARQVEVEVEYKGRVIKGSDWIYWSKMKSSLNLSLCPRFRMWPWHSFFPI